jgi:hypothetical protein
MGLDVGCRRPLHARTELVSVAHALAAFALPLALLGACSSSAHVGVGTGSDAVVYGQDDRVEVFEASGRLRELAESSLVALVTDTEDPWAAPSWSSVDALCPDVRYAEQPSGATCTGVLTAPDLVLTAGHCARNLDCSALRIIFGFHYDGAEQPHPLDSDDVFYCREVVDYSVPSVLGALDFGWLRLDRRADGRGRAAALPRVASASMSGSAVQTVGFSGGIPAKVRGGGKVLDDREATLDYFTTDLDLFAGDSGAPVLDAAGSIVGIASGGEQDLQLDLERQCHEVTAFNGSDGMLGERITYAFQAVSSLCESGKGDESLCRSATDSEAAAGCSVAPGRTSRVPQGFMLVLCVAVKCRRRRKLLIE